MIVLKSGEVYNDDEFYYALEQIKRRYSKALDAKPSKGPITDIDSLTDSVCDVPWLLNVVYGLLEEIEELSDELMDHAILKGDW